MRRKSRERKGARGNGNFFLPPHDLRLALSRIYFPRREYEKKKSIRIFTAMKEKGEPDYLYHQLRLPTATFAERAGMDMILVGDSLDVRVRVRRHHAGHMDMMIVHSERCAGGRQHLCGGDILSFPTRPRMGRGGKWRAVYKKRGWTPSSSEGGVRITPIKAMSMRGCGHGAHRLTPRAPRN